MAKGNTKPEKSSTRLVSAQNGMKPRGQPTVIVPSSTPKKRQNEVAKVPLYTETVSSNAKRNQERDRSHRRPRRTRPGRTTSHGIHPRSSDWYLDFSYARSLELSRRGLRRYVNDFISGRSSKHTLSRNTDSGTVSDQISSVPGRDQTSLPESSDHTVDQGLAPERKSDWKPTAYATTKLAVHLVKESPDGFPPLKSVMGGLSAILGHCDVRFTSSKLCHS